MHTLQDRSADLPVEIPATPLLSPVATHQPDGSPLLILDAGEFQARCRCCGLRSTRQPTPGGAWAEFEAHTCQEPLS
jgi:hypothetical protein